MASKKTPRRKTPVKKLTSTFKKTNVSKISKSILSKRGGPNININIDQSKRTKKSGQTAPQRQPSVISTYTPVQAPSPIFNFPLPTNLNPFENVVRETQKAKIQEEPNGLEKPKPKEKEDVVEDPNVSILNKKEKRENESMGMEDFDVPENMAKKEEKMRRRNKGKGGQPDLSESLWFNPSREADTPLEEQARSASKSKPNLLTIYQPKERVGKSTIMTMQLLNEQPLKTDRKDKDDEFKPFTGSGNVLGTDIMNRLNREELRKKRLEMLDKDKFSLEPKENYKSPEIVKQEQEYIEYEEYLKGLVKSAPKMGRRQSLFPEAKQQGIQDYNKMKTQTLLEQLKKKKQGN